MRKKAILKVRLINDEQGTPKSYTVMKATGGQELIELIEGALKAFYQALHAIGAEESYTEIVGVIAERSKETALKERKEERDE